MTQAQVEARRAAMKLARAQAMATKKVTKAVFE